MLTGLAVYTPEEIQEDIKDKKPIKIRIALFFDGTMNNRMNIEERELHQLGKEDKVTAEDYAKFTKNPANSYMNGRTNIAIMEPNVEETADGYELFYKHYIAGQGPITYQADSLWGYAIAIGETGVPGRAEEGIRYAVDSILNDTTIDRGTQYIQKLTIDVFGFSRGAATARYAIHIIFEGRLVVVNNENGSAAYTPDNVASELDRFDYVIQQTAVEVGFAGLYDTVLSYIGSQILPGKLAKMLDILKQTAVQRAKKTLHLAAADEHRADFSLIRIQSAVNSGKGEEYFLPGVHSDIGGSYNQANEEILKNETDEDKKIYMRPSSEGSHDDITTNWLGNVTSNTMVINEGDSERMKKDRHDLIDQGWYQEHEITYHDVSWTTAENGDRIATTGMLTVSRENISSAYCNIPLKIMAKAARDASVKLKIDAKLEDIADKILDTAKDPKTGKNELKELEAKITDYMASHKNNSEPEHWIDDKAERNDAALKQIRHKHFHFSASKLSLGYKPRFEWDDAAWKFRRKRYYYDA